MAFDVFSVSLTLCSTFLYRLKKIDDVTRNRKFSRRSRKALLTFTWRTITSRCGFRFNAGEGKPAIIQLSVLEIRERAPFTGRSRKGGCHASASSSLFGSFLRNTIQSSAHKHSPALTNGRFQWRNRRQVWSVRQDATCSSARTLNL